MKFHYNTQIILHYYSPLGSRTISKLWCGPYFNFPIPYTNNPIHERSLFLLIGTIISWHSISFPHTNKFASQNSLSFALKKYLGKFLASRVKNLYWQKKFHGNSKVEILWWLKKYLIPIYLNYYLTSISKYISFSLKNKLKDCLCKFELFKSIEYSWCRGKNCVTSTPFSYGTRKPFPSYHTTFLAP